MTRLAEVVRQELHGVGAQARRILELPGVLPPQGQDALPHVLRHLRIRRIADFRDLIGEAIKLSAKLSAEPIKIPVKGHFAIRCLRSQQRSIGGYQRPSAAPLLCTRSSLEVSDPLPPLDSPRRESEVDGP